MTTTTAAAPSDLRPSSVRINPDNRFVLTGLLVVLVAVAAASFTLSFTGVSAAAPWASIPVRLAWLVPVALEVAMLAYVVAASVRTHRGQRAALAWTLVWALTTVSSALNALHAWDAGPQGWQGAVGAGLAGMFPFMTLAAAHVVIGVAFAPRPDTTTTDTRTDADTGRTPASAETTAVRSDTTPDAQHDESPATLVLEHVAELHDATSADRQADVRRTTRTVGRGRVAEHRTDILRLAAAGRSGRSIATELGLDKTAVCAVVREVRAQTDTSADAALLPV
jgi:hypothetical protein